MISTQPSPTDPSTNEPAGPGHPRPFLRRFRLSVRGVLLLILMVALGMSLLRYYHHHIQKRIIVYSVGDLMPAITRGNHPKSRPGSGPSILIGSRPQSDFASLINAIRANVNPGSWEGQGGTGTIIELYLNDSLIIRTSQANHDRIAEYLRQRRNTP